MKKSLLLLFLFGLCHVGMGKVPPPPTVPPVPHRDVVGEEASKADAVRQALEEILRAKSLPLASSGQRYEFTALSCRNLWVPIAKGHYCDFDYRIDSSGKLISVAWRDEPPVDLAETLFAKLNAAGATYYEDFAHGAFMTLKNVVMKWGELHFDDYSNYRPPPQPNVLVTGQLARDILGALDRAGIDDEDGSLLLICTCFEKSLKCDFQLHQKPGAALTPGDSQRLWSAIKEAAVASGFRPPWDGTLDEMTVLNASDFTWDGAKLGLLLVAGKAPAPPGPPRSIKAPWSTRRQDDSFRQLGPKVR